MFRGSLRPSIGVRVVPRYNQFSTISFRLQKADVKVNEEGSRSVDTNISLNTNTNQNTNTNPTPSTNTNPNTNKKNFSSDVVNLMRLARPEFKLIVGALGCLVTTSTITMTLPLIIGKIIDNVKNDSALIWGLPENYFYLGLTMVFSIGACTNFGRIYLLKLVGEKLVARLRSRLFLKILSQDSYFFDRGMKVGDLISRISSDTQVISRSLSGNISDGARALISAVVGLSMMWYVLWKMTLCMGLIFPPLIVMSAFYGRRIKQITRLVQDNLGSLTKVTEEKLNGIKTIQNFARQQLVVHDYNKEIRNLFKLSMQEGKLTGIFYGGNGFLGNIMIVGLLYIGTRLIHMGEISLGDLSSFMIYAAYTGSSVFGLGNFYTELMKGMGAAERVFELAHLEPEIKPTIGKKLDSVKGDIVFKDVVFHYPSRPDARIFTATNPFNLTIKQGENVCIVGPSGSGKSTLSQLLLRFYDPISGCITIDNNDVKLVNLNDFRRKIGYVEQESLLFSSSIKDNITFGVDHYSQEDIDYALSVSNCEFVHRFPQGIDTMVGSSSASAGQLSGGQRQRVSLARTLIKRPNILILDEATLALDSILESSVLANLRDLNRVHNTTIILIAHKLSTIKNSDRVVVLGPSGDIVEDGGFRELYYDQQSQLNQILKKNRD